MDSFIVENHSVFTKPIKMVRSGLAKTDPVKFKNSKFWEILKIKFLKQIETI
jgi:hypothetical protein